MTNDKWKMITFSTRPAIAARRLGARVSARKGVLPSQRTRSAVNATHSKSFGIDGRGYGTSGILSLV